MAGIQTIDLTLVSPLAAGAVPTDPWWLRIDQEKEDDRATTAEVAELVDTLYDLNPCVETEETGAPATEKAEPTPTDLLAASKKAYAKAGQRTADLAACKQGMEGNYTAQLKIVRSHQSEGYRLVFGVAAGKVKIESTIVTNEEIDTVIDIAGASEYTLEFPVAAAFHASWQGSVSGDKGSISPPPVIKRLGNTLFWDGGSVTGSIRVVYQTIYDLVTVSVPGKPKFAGATVGDPQDATVLAFFHRLIFSGQVSPPPTDDSADQATLGELCDWSDSETPPDDDPEPPEPPPVDGPKIGCLTPDQRLANPAYYEQKCCTPPPFGLPDCAVSAASKPGKGLDPAVMAQIIAGHDGPVEFIAVGPGPQGCGRIFTRQRVQPKSCCDEVVPMSPRSDNPTSISPGGAVILHVLDGRENVEWLWMASGGLLFANNQSSIITLSRDVYVYAPVEGFCASAVVLVDDGCTVLNLPLENLGVEVLEIQDLGGPVAPGSSFWLEAIGGLSPFYWSPEGDLSLISGQGLRSALFSAAEEFCGSATVQVSDGCTAMASTVVRSTAGHWEPILNPADTNGYWCDCDEAAGPPEQLPSDGGYLKYATEKNGYRCVYTIRYSFPSWLENCVEATYCNGADVAGILAMACESGALSNYSYPPDLFHDTRPCCLLEPHGVGGDLQLYLSTYLLIQKFQWVC